MALFINSNISALQAMQGMSRSQSALNTIYQRLSTGLRINSAKDDPAGLQISNRMTTQINGLTQGNRNASDAIALAQTQEGAMDEVTNMLQELRTLAISAASGTTTDSERDAIQQQADQLVSEITRIAKQTTFGGRTVLDGAGAGSIFATDQINIQVGANDGDVVTMDAVNMKFEKIFGNADISLSSAQNASDAIADLDTALQKVDSSRADLGAIQQRLESAIRSQENTITNQTDARQRILEADYATEIANLSKQTILQQMASMVLMQANTRPQLALSLLG